jgi:hypothetical protein
VSLTAFFIFMRLASGRPHQVCFVASYSWHHLRLAFFSGVEHCHSAQRAIMLGCRRSSLLFVVGVTRDAVVIITFVASDARLLRIYSSNNYACRVYCYERN